MFDDVVDEATTGDVQASRGFVEEEHVGFSGENLRELRARKPEIRVIFVSGYAEEAFRKNLPEGQQFDFLPKPFSLKQLIEAVKRVMS